jgi:hypothetical protein
VYVASVSGAFGLPIAFLALGRRVRRWSERNGRQDIHQVSEGRQEGSAKVAAKPRKGSKAAKPRKTAPKAKSGKVAKPVLLSGGNPQIAVGYGDAPVQAYIAAMPGWKRDVGRRLDTVIERTVPRVYKAVKMELAAVRI